MNTEKIAIETIRAAIQSRLEPELKSVSERLTHVEARLDQLDQRVERLEQRLQWEFKSMREDGDFRFEGQHRVFFAHLDAVRAEIRSVETVAEFRERVASLEAKFAQQG